MAQVSSANYKHTQKNAVVASHRIVVHSKCSETGKPLNFPVTQQTSHRNIKKIPKGCE